MRINKYDNDDGFSRRWSRALMENANISIEQTKGPGKYYFLSKIVIPVENTVKFKFLCHQSLYFIRMS